MFWLDRDEGLMARVRNDAEAKDILKILRGHLRSLSLDKAVNPDLDLVVEHFHMFIIDLLKETPRPTVKLLTESAKLAFDDVPFAECRLWAQRICESITHCRNKRSQSTSGKKLPDAVRLVVKVIAGQATMGEKLIEKARHLQRSSPVKATKPAPAEKPVLLQQGTQKAKAAQPQQLSACVRQLFTRDGRTRHEAQQSISTSAPSSAKPHLPVERIQDSLSSSSANCLSPSPSPAPAMGKAQCNARSSIFAALGVTEPECCYLSSQDDEQCNSQPSVSNVDTKRNASSSASTSSVSKSASASTEPKSAYKEYVDSSTFTLVRLHVDQRIDKARMEAGPLGFLIGYFGTDATGIQTEIPNLMLGLQSTPVLKRPAAKDANPKRKKQKKLASDSEDAADADPLCEVASKSSGSSEHEPGEPNVQGIAEGAHDAHDEKPQYLKYKYTHAQKGNIRAYVQGLETETNKWKLLAEVSQKQSLAYLSVISDVHQQCIDMQLDKPSTKALATRLLTTDRYVHK
jgi:hypothetical protein